MKLNKIKLFVLAILAGGLFTACNTDNEAAIYDVTTPNISFVDPAIETLTSEASATVKVRVTRFGKSGSYTVHYTGVASEEGIFTDENNGEVTFNDGEGVAYITLKADNMEKGNSYEYTLTLSDDDVATVDETIGHPITEATVVVECDYTWQLVATGTYQSPYNFETEWAQEIYQAEEDPSVYKFNLASMADTGGIPMYDMKLTIDDEGKIIVPFQKGWVYPGYGDVYVAGNFNDDIYSDDPSYIAGSWDKENGVMTMYLFHYLASIGYAFGTIPDYFVFTLDEAAKKE